MKLTEIARKTIEKYFEGKKFELDFKTKEKYSQKRACFVTLTKKGELRGCIGSLVPRQELWKDVQENAVNAAFRDFRFLPLQREELEEIKIEVSVLSIPKKIYFKNPEELLSKLDRKYGVVLKNKFGEATFLPQVWKEIPNKKEFLEQLSLKAGLEKDGWKNSEILIYNVEIFNEN